MAFGTLIAKAKSGSAGSYYKLAHVPVSEVDGFFRAVDDSGFFVGNISLKSYGRWRNMPVVAGSNMPWQITEKESKNGTIYTATASGTLMGGGEPSDMRVLRDMKESKHLIKLQLADGRILLFADYEFPAEFNFKVEGQSQKNELRRVSFTFEAQSPNEICQI